MLIEHQHRDNKSIMVSVIGVPNVGKSSLVNYLLGMDLSIVTNRPQTTRNKFHCVFTIDHTEIILVDTPGLHKSGQEFHKRLNEQAREGLHGVDLNLLLVDISREIFPQVVEVKNSLENDLGPTWVVFTKCDRVANSNELPLEEIFAKIKEIIPSVQRYFVLSAKTGENAHLLTGALCDVAPSSPHHYTQGEVSNKNERFFATEYIREQAFQLLNEEVPYEVAVVIEDYRDQFEEKKDSGKNAKGDRRKERGERIASHISASILVNRPSQRAIVVGSKGSMIKEIGIRSRQKIEAMVGAKVHLNLHVKVSPKWFSNNLILEELGLPRAKDSSRVWRKKSEEGK